MRANSLFVGCVLLVGCRRGTLAGDAGEGVIGTPGRDGAARDVTPGDAGPASAVWSAWPLPNHDPASTRRSPGVGPQAPVDRFMLDVVPERLVIGVDGTLYATDWGDTHPVAAFDPATGARLWTFTPAPAVPTTVPPFSPSIAAGPEGNLYVAYQQGSFYALRPDGSVRWQFTTGKSGRSGDLSMFSPPLVEASGRVYVGESSTLYAFESDGRRAWQYDARSIQGVSPAGLAADGTVYVQESYGPLQALDRDGTHRWTLPITAYVAGVVVRDDGTLLFAELGERQFGAVDAGGAVQWQKPGSFAGFALGGDGAPYAADGTGVLRLDREGSTVWQAAAGGHGAIVDGVGTVYSAAPGAIAAVDANGIVKWELPTVDPAVPGSGAAAPTLYAIGGDGTLYAGINGRIHAIGGGGRCEGMAIDCDDGDPCTVDRCDAQAGCVHAPKCASSTICAGAGCAPDGTCTFAIASDTIGCDDGIACSEGDRCSSGQCTARSSSCALAGAWPAVGHDARHTRATTLLGPAGANLAATATGARGNAFVIADDGTLYATDGQQVSAIRPDGTVAPFAPVPARDLLLRQDGGLYATTQDALHALGAAGETQWTFEASFVSPPAVGPSGAIYLRAGRDLVALAPDGSTLWRIPTGGGYASPAVGPDGTIYALCPDLWAIASDGRVKWKRAIGWASGLVVGPTGTTYAMLDGRVRAIDANGADAWMWSLGTSAALVPALSPRGDLILIAWTRIYRLDASTGALRSTSTPPTPATTVQPLAPPIVDGDGVLYLIGNATDTNSFQPMTQVTLFAIDRTDQLLWAAPLAHGLNAGGANLAIGPGRTLTFTINGALQTIGP